LGRQDEPSLATLMTDHDDLGADIDDLAGHSPVKVGGTALGLLTRRDGLTCLCVSGVRSVGARASIGAIGRITRRRCQPRLEGRRRRERLDRRNPGRRAERLDRRNPRNRRNPGRRAERLDRRNPRNLRGRRRRPNLRGSCYLRDLRGLLGLEYRGLEQPTPRDVTGVGQSGAGTFLAAHFGRFHLRTRPSSPFTNPTITFPELTLLSYRTHVKRFAGCFGTKSRPRQPMWSNMVETGLPAIAY